MSNSALPGAHPIPSHVPPNLVLPFDFFSDAEYATDPFEVLRRRHREGPRVFFTPVHYQKPGSWVLTQAADIREVWQNPELWSSLHNVNFSAIIGESWALSPVELDPPLHGKIRAFLNPFFSPNRLKLLEDDVSGIAVGLIDNISKRGECEFINDFSYPFPVSVFLKMMGLNADGLYQFVDWVKGTTDALHVDRIRASVKAIADYMKAEIAKRRETPNGDLMSQIVNMNLDGQPASDEQVMGICYLLFLGGLDTMTASLGFHFAFLAQNQQLQRELRADRSKIGATIEELLRLNSIVQVQRCATRDTELAGVRIKKGDWVTLSPGMAHADEREFERPDIFDPNRTNVRHMAFAVGPHRCMGSHLARREFIVAYNEWFDRIPPFRIKEGTRPLTHGGPVFGVSKLELSWRS
jgi:cytochrome P450